MLTRSDRDGTDMSCKLKVRSFKDGTHIALHSCHQRLSQVIVMTQGAVGMGVARQQMHAAAEAQPLAPFPQQDLPYATVLPALLPLAYTPVSVVAAEAVLPGTCPEWSVTCRKLWAWSLQAVRCLLHQKHSPLPLPLSQAFSMLQRCLPHCR